MVALDRKVRLVFLARPEPAVPPAVPLLVSQGHQVLPEVRDQWEPRVTLGQRVKQVYLDAQD